MICSTVLLLLLTRQFRAQSYIGCFVDGPVRDLGQLYSGNGDYNFCLAQCRSNGYPYMGLQIGSECRCDVVYGRYGQAPDSECNMLCSDGYSCGAGWRNSVYLTGITSVQLNISNVQFNNTPDTTLFGAQYLGCFADQSHSDLNFFKPNSSLQFDTYETVSDRRDCFEFCSMYSFKYAGLQSSVQCMCSNTYGKYGSVNGIYCNFLCPANVGFCGGNSVNSIYDLTSYQKVSTPYLPEPLGCYYDAKYRDMSFNDTFPTVTYGYYNTNMGYSVCLAICRAGGYFYMGIEIGLQCFCSNTYGRYGQALSSDCSNNCRDVQVPCGNGWRLSVYLTGISNQALVIQNEVISNSVYYQDLLSASYLGCYADGSPLDLNFNGSSVLSNSPSLVNDPIECFEYCKMLGFRYAGLQYGQKCYCGSSYGAYGLASNALQCNFACANSSYMCGGFSFNMVYDITNYKNITAPFPVSYLGCFVDGIIPDIGYNPLNGMNSLNQITYSNFLFYACLASCRRRGLLYFGLQNDQTCYCGNSYGNYGQDSDSNCTILCVDSNRNCGGVYRNAVYSTGISPKILQINNTQVANQRYISYYGATYIGCFFKPTNTSSYLVGGTTQIILRTCLEYCNRLNVSLAGVYNGNECYCPTSITGYNQDVTELSCNFYCYLGNGVCGGPSSVSLYNVTSYSYAPLTTSSKLAPSPTSSTLASSPTSSKLTLSSVFISISSVFNPTLTSTATSISSLPSSANDHGLLKTTLSYTLTVNSHIGPFQTNPTSQTYPVSDISVTQIVKFITKPEFLISSAVGFVLAIALFSATIQRKNKPSVYNRRRLHNNSRLKFHVINYYGSRIANRMQ